jgi:beta-lactamase superfamily II metal-dependent hydrolase
VDIEKILGMSLNFFGQYLRSPIRQPNMVLPAQSQASTISAYLYSVRVSSLDDTLVSHMHADHMGGMDGVLTAYPEIVASFDHGSSYSSQEYLDYAADTRCTTVQASDMLDLGASVAGRQNKQCF